MSYLRYPLKLEKSHIKYIEGFFVTKMTDHKELDINYLCTLLDSVHEAYVDRYPNEGLIDDKERNGIAQVISNLAKRFNKHNLDGAQEKFINQLKDFYTVEIEKTKGL